MLSLTTDKSSATLCDDDGFDIHYALVYGVTPAGFLFLVCIVLIVVICVLVCIITLKKDTHTPKLMYYLVKNAEPDTKTQLEMPTNFTAQTADQLQATVTVMGTPTQRDIRPAGEDGVAAAGNQSGAPSRDQQTGNGGIDQVDTGITVPPLSQQQSVISSNVKSRSAHKVNPVYQLVKQSMKDAKFPERKYRRLKEELRSTCEKCKKEQ